MKIIQVISEHKRIRGRQLSSGKFSPPIRPKKGYKRVEAIVEIGGFKQTKHLDVKK